MEEGEEKGGEERIGGREGTEGEKRERKGEERPGWGEKGKGERRMGRKETQVLFTNKYTLSCQLKS